jgi:hypothetical protein
MMMRAYLKLVSASLSGWGWVEEINCENLYRQHHVSVGCLLFINQANIYIHSIPSISVV